MIKGKYLIKTILRQSVPFRKLGHIYIIQFSALAILCDVNLSSVVFMLRIVRVVVIIHFRCGIPDQCGQEHR